MKSIKKTIKRIIKAIKNKPSESITIGVDITNCKDCEYKNLTPFYPKIKNGDTFLKLSPEVIPGEYTAMMLLDIIRRYCNHNKISIAVDMDNKGNYTNMEFIKKEDI